MLGLQFETMHGSQLTVRIILVGHLQSHTLY